MIFIVGGSNEIVSPPRDIEFPSLTMDLPQIGAHCALSSCNVLDFLPITCKCNRQFCSEHITPDRHDCSAFAAATVDISTSLDPIQRCGVHGCNKPSLRIFNRNTDETCSLCHQSFCPEYVLISRTGFATHFRTSHRFPELHKCSSIIEKKSDNMTIKNVSSSVRNSSLATPRKHKPPRDPAKLAQWQKVELMKMRHRAVPGDPKDRNTSILPDQRHHVKVVIDNAEKIFWFRKVGSHDK